MREQPRNTKKEHSKNFVSLDKCLFRIKGSFLLFFLSRYKFRQKLKYVITSETHMRIAGLNYIFIQTFYIVYLNLNNNNKQRDIVEC